jgi:hypothetical protein
MERSAADEILTVAEVAEYLKVHRTTIYKLLKGAITSVQNRLRLSVQPRADR